MATAAVTVRSDVFKRMGYDIAEARHAGQGSLLGKIGIFWSCGIGGGSSPASDAATRPKEINTARSGLAP
jgi:hypothetical protein